MIELLESAKLLAWNAAFNPLLLVFLLILFFAGRFFGKLTKRLNIWKILIVGYFALFLYGPVRDSGPFIGGLFVLGILSNHIGTFISVLSWAGSIPEAFFALRYRSAYEDIRRREKEIEERERRLTEEERRRAYQQQNEGSQSKAGWQKDAKGFRDNPRNEKSKSRSDKNQYKNTRSAHSNENKNKQRQPPPPPNDVRERHLQTLGLDPRKNHNRESIKKAFRRKVMKAHPDAGGSQEEFIAIKSAYEWLTQSS